MSGGSGPAVALSLLHCHLHHECVCVCVCVCVHVSVVCVCACVRVSSILLVYMNKKHKKVQHMYPHIVQVQKYCLLSYRLLSQTLL